MAPPTCPVCSCPAGFIVVTGGAAGGTATGTGVGNASTVGGGTATGTGVGNA